MNTNRITSLLAILLCSLALPAFTAEEAPDPYEGMGWTQLGEPLQLPTEVSKATGSQEPLPLAKIEQPEITEPNHLIAGMIRYEDVAGVGFVEMWTFYGEEERYFSRTLGDFGPMAKLSGSSEWRQVMLPFRGESDRHPVKLEVNVVLPGGGKVEFKDFALYQSGAVHGGGWWAPGESIAGVNITIMAVLFLIGMAVILSTRGKARGLSLGLLRIFIIVGAVGLIGGTIALSTRQSPGLWVPLVACGAIALIGGAVGFFLARRNFLKHELRRISAVDCAT